MSRIKIDLRAATTEQLAAQLLTILRENTSGRSTVGYFPGCLESILQFDFAPKELGLDVRGGVWVQPGGAVSTYGGDRGSAGLRKEYAEAVHWLRQHGYIVRDHTQSNDQFAEVTSQGSTVEIDQHSMAFVIPRKWSHWKSEYESSVVHLGIRKDGSEFSGTAFFVGSNLLATCEHNFVGEAFVYIDNEAVPAADVRKHSSADVALFSLGSHAIHRLRSLPLRHDLPNPGDEVAVMGYPAVPQRQPTLNISVGAVEALPTNYKATAQFIQVSIATAGGYSGGPLLDECGRVVGVVSERTFEVVQDQVVPSRAFAQVVPISYLLELLGSRP